MTPVRRSYLSLVVVVITSAIRRHVRVFSLRKASIARNSFGIAPTRLCRNFSFTRCGSSCCFVTAGTTKLILLSPFSQFIQMTISELVSDDVDSTGQPGSSPDLSILPRHKPLTFNLTSSFGLAVTDRLSFWPVM
ncbi:hypothetical protein M440DRAFT_1159435 [Trichoderma longibrachiatum ATCC 18648]|uniref:Uncharacterized protein n=1 Tax=Trichoderma longibrachiatum ATCC 18648 TaxID=983965 RepID=A0A2T4CBY1_TRILO|nr:hypothetical protein M440DRAFT_1159435 [Trichoderma longibrachiatum ATCC 18648]